MLNPILVAFMVTCYNGTDVMYKGTNVVYIRTKIEAVNEEGKAADGTLRIPFEYVTHCTLGTGEGVRYECSSCDIQKEPKQ